MLGEIRKTRQEPLTLSETQGIVSHESDMSRGKKRQCRLLRFQNIPFFYQNLSRCVRLCVHSENNGVNKFQYIFTFTRSLLVVSLMKSLVSVMDSQV